MFVNINDVFRNVETGDEFTVVAKAPDTTRIVCEAANGTPFSFNSNDLEDEKYVLVRGDIGDLFYKWNEDIISASEAGY